MNRDLQSHSAQISIHALREEGDDAGFYEGYDPEDFYPRPPRGGRLHISFNNSFFFKISIHALREEGDFVAAMTL